MSLEQSFKEAADTVRNLKNRPDNTELLELYGLYKQGTLGDVTGTQPWAVQLEARAKWDSWNSRKGLSTDEAQEKYIAAAEALITKYGP